MYLCFFSFKIVQPMSSVTWNPASFALQTKLILLANGTHTYQLYFYLTPSFFCSSIFFIEVIKGTNKFFFLQSIAWGENQTGQKKEKRKKCGNPMRERITDNLRNLFPYYDRTTFDRSSIWKMRPRSFIYKLIPFLFFIVPFSPHVGFSEFLRSSSSPLQCINFQWKD